MGTGQWHGAVHLGRLVDSRRWRTGEERIGELLYLYLVLV